MARFIAAIARPSTNERLEKTQIFFFSVFLLRVSVADVALN
jgi:hypothetical protein